MTNRFFIIAAVLTIALVAIISASVFAAPQCVNPLTKVNGEVDVAYMASSYYRYYADVFASFDIGAYHDTSLFVGGGVLTWILGGSENNGFQPDRLRGTIEGGAYKKHGEGTLTAYVKHQSFHVIDRPKPITGNESYEVYSLGYARTGPPNLFLAAGKYLNVDSVDYDWDFIATVDTSTIGVLEHSRPYVEGDLHYVVTKDTPFNRSNFLDYNAEVGYQLRSGVKYFVAYRQIHDINQAGGATDRHIAAGIKYRW